MFSTCLFCNKSLGANESIGPFPVGRRLAFDQRRGRLWVVCRACGKWNLTPLEERWEAIEDCERLFRDSPKRVSTDQVGLARLAEGLELVRIGEPQRPEFAAWRYGDQFGRRRRKEQVRLGAGIVVMAGATVLMVANTVSPLAGGLGMVAPWVINVLNLRNFAGTFVRRRRRVAVVHTAAGDRVQVSGRDLNGVRLVPSGDQGWALEIPHFVRSGSPAVTLLEGEAARRAAARVVPRLTPQGGDRKQVDAAVQRIERQGDPERYLAWLARNVKRHDRRVWSAATGTIAVKGSPADSLEGQGLEACLAVEMAVNEQNERIVLESELALLEDAWREAEEIAAIADSLALPTGVEEQLGRLKGPPPR